VIYRLAMKMLEDPQDAGRVTGTIKAQKHYLV
jgi:hypothetical protein